MTGIVVSGSVAATDNRVNAIGNNRASSVSDRIMRFLITLVFCVLVGCGGQQTLDELEKEALVSGDWTEVEKRELMIQRRNGKFGQACPDRLTRVCIEKGTSVVCECVRPGPRRVSTTY